MTPERFEILAEAYGGDVARWPSAERAAAAALAASSPEWARAVLGQAGEVDAALDAFTAPGASAALYGRILAAAPARSLAWRGWLMPVGLGAGLAAASAAGLLVGARLAEPAASSPDPVVAA